MRLGYFWVIQKGGDGAAGVTLSRVPSPAVEFVLRRFGSGERGGMFQLVSAEGSAACCVWRPNHP